MPRISNRTSRFVGLVIALMVLMSVPRQASAAISGNFGCLGNITFSFIPFGSSQQTATTYSQIMRLAISPTGAVTANIFYGVSGVEICKFVGKGTISVDATGVGLMTLIFPSTGKDEDNDVANCGSYFFGVPGPNVTENFHIVTVKTNTQFYFLGKDGFLTPSTGDRGDFPGAPTGECTKQ